MRRLGIVFAVGIAACTAETGQSLQVLGALAPQADCTFSADSTLFRSVGAYDPRGYGSYAPDSYVLGLAVQNNMATPAGDPALTTNNRNVRSPANDVTVAGIEACWDLAATHTAPTAFDAGPAFQCDALPTEQRSFVNATTTVTAGGKAVLVVDVLSLKAMQAAGIFGSNFDPRNLPTTAVQATTILGPTFSFPVTEPASTPTETRSQAWGAFPNDPLNTARVLVQARVVGQTQTGVVVKSNWVVYPIDVTPGALSLACQPTPGFATCSTGTMYIGNFVDLGNSCLPGRGGSLACVAVTACPSS